MAYVSLISLVMVLRDEKPCGEPCLELEREEDSDRNSNHMMVIFTDIPCDIVAGVLLSCFSAEGVGSEVCSRVGCGSIVSAGYETQAA